ncbi:MAG: insulinase family protein [Alphaproteobacteria bacterium]|nr:insulinase family protein [Alphaproteobacteria bacterium]
MSRSPFPNHPPLATSTRAWQFPEHARWTLPNGLEVVALPSRRLPAVRLRLASLGGLAWEATGVRGAASLAGTTTRHGAGARDSAELAAHLDDLGARLRVGLSNDDHSVSIHALSEHTGPAFAALADLALRPTFPDDHLARERAKAIEARRHRRANPRALAGDWLGLRLYGAHPYGLPPTTEDELAAVGRAEVLRFHREVRVPQGSLLVAVGDLDPEQIRALAAQHLGDWTGASAAAEAPAPPEDTGPRRVVLVHRPGAEQAVISVGMLALPRRHPDFLAARLMNQVLGGAAASRLFTDLRERRGLTYGCYSSLNGERHAGELVVSLSCSANNAAEALEALFGHLERIRSELVPEPELDAARRYLVGAFPLAAMSLRGLSGLLRAAWLHGLPEGCWSAYASELGGLTADDVLQVARRLIHPDRAPVVVVGDADALEATCARWGPVERHASDQPPHR